MNDYLMLNDLFNDKQDSIGFQLFKKSNIIKLNNNDKGNYSDNQIEVNTLNISNKMINYSNAYIELELTALIDYDQSDGSGKESIPKLISLKSSYEIVTSLRIMLNNTIISNENYTKRSNLINYILNYGKFYPISHRNSNKAIGTLSVSNIKFRSKVKYKSENTTNHQITFKIHIYLKDINNFLKTLE